MANEAIRYAVEYIAYFFDTQPAFDAMTVEKFSIELANAIHNYIKEEHPDFFRRRTPFNRTRECCQRSDELVMEINVDGRLTALIDNVAQTWLGLTTYETVSFAI